ncbi:MAG: hypothetical protein A3E87_01605 [Gammaproteobacteria bacterium RIFCSPHIGHO2_12_FULL_35_23]|nr:MAG: hypothetical protein A3E87_01605 [Gammaproteobacteria bacterium RIFCSPHIGHO2_12_FULL_35_23]
MTKSILTRDINGYVNYGLLPCENIVSVNLDANVAASFTVPGDSGFLWDLVFSIEPGASIWIAFDAASGAALPAGNTFAATFSCQNPGVRRVPGGTVVSAITANTTAYLGVEMYVFQS